MSNSVMFKTICSYCLRLDSVKNTPAHLIDWYTTKILTSFHWKKYMYRFENYRVIYKKPIPRLWNLNFMKDVSLFIENAASKKVTTKWCSAKISFHFRKKKLFHSTPKQFADFPSAIKWINLSKKQDWKWVLRNFVWWWWSRFIPMVLG